MILELTEEELELVRGLLQKELDDLRGEVYHADIAEYKDQLKRDEALVRDILAKFPVRV